MSVAQVPVQRSIETARNPGRWMTLESIIVALFTFSLDRTLMGLITPAAVIALGVDSATNGLISPIDTLMLAGLFLSGDTLEDIDGHKRIITYGLIEMTVTSIHSILAPSTGVLIPSLSLA